MKIAIASDHAGYNYKEAIKAHLIKLGHDVIDKGTDAAERCDYPDFCGPAAQAVANGEAERCIVLGGSGNGEAMVANRVKGVRCAVVYDEQTAVWARGHNNANGLALGERTVSEETALKLVDIWLEEPFEGGRHEPRIAKIDDYS